MARGHKGRRGAADEIGGAEPKAESPIDLPSWMGSLRGQIKFTPVWDEPDEDLIRLMEDGPVFPPDEAES